MKKFYDHVDSNFIKEFRERAINSKSIVLTSHIAPDEDSISSVLAIHYYLTEVLKIEKTKIHMPYTWEKIDTWNYFKRFAEIEFVDDIYGYIKEDDLVIFVDGSGWRRFSRKPEINKLKNYVICIDHHQTPEDKFDLHLVTPQYTSTAEVIYRLFFEKERLDKEICEIILMGILGDTGNFRFVKPEQAEVFLIAERLVREGGITVESLQSKYNYLTLEVYKVLQELMKNSLVEKVENWPDFLVSYLTTDYIKENNLTAAEINEASGQFDQYLKSIKGIEWGIALMPRLKDRTCKLSLRSIPKSVSVRDLMEKTKFGGGHDRAAGGSIGVGEPQEAVKILLDWMRKNRPVIV